MRRLIPLALLLLLSACNLYQAPASEGAQGQMTALPNGGPSLVASCDPSQSGAGWYLYTAQAGETIAEVIVRAGASRDMVVSGNCWTTLPEVTAGSQWYMPSASIESLPNLTGVPEGGDLVVMPSDFGIGGTLSIDDPQVNIGMEDFPPETASVFFYVRVDGDVVAIGTDPNMTDGASITWQVVPGLTFERAALAAVAFDASATPILHTAEFSINTV
jgi:hypothetical protein